jgi:hypothetical protein
MASQIHATLTDKQPYDHARHVAALRALPAPGGPSARDGSSRAPTDTGPV